MIDLSSMDIADLSQQIFWGLREKDSEKMVRIESYGDCCNRSYNLSLNEDLPYFLLDSKKDVVSALHQNPSDINSSNERPSWGKIDPASLELVEIVIDAKVNAEALPPLPITFKCFETRDIPRKVAVRYIPDIDKLEEDASLVLVVAGIPEGKTVDSMSTLIGEKHYFGYSRREIYGVRSPVEEYEDLGKGTSVAMFICGTGF